MSRGSEKIIGWRIRIRQFADASASCSGSSRLDLPCIDTMRRSGKTAIEVTPRAQEQWVAHVNEIVGGTLLPRANSWWMSANVAGKPRAFLPYLDPEGRRLPLSMRRDRGQRLPGIRADIAKKLGADKRVTALIRAILTESGRDSDQ